MTGYDPTTGENLPLELDEEELVLTHRTCCDREFDLDFEQEEWDAHRAWHKRQESDYTDFLLEEPPVAGVPERTEYAPELNDAEHQAQRQLGASYHKWRRNRTALEQQRKEFKTRRFQD